MGAMMLPEHVALIRQYNKEIKKVPRPDLDEWDLDAIQENIEIAMKRNVDVKIKTWEEVNSYFIMEKLPGWIWVDEQSKWKMYSSLLC